jgi:hypothetical protein
LTDSLTLSWCARQEYFTCVVKGQGELERFKEALEAEVRQAFDELEGAVLEAAAAARGASFFVSGIHALDQRVNQLVRAFCACMLLCVWVLE